MEFTLGTIARGQDVPYYHFDRAFRLAESNIQENLDTLNGETDKQIDIVKGEAIKIDTNNTYAIERQAVTVGYDSAGAAWDAVVNHYDRGAERRYPGKIFHNVGWVRGTKSIQEEWGAFLWMLQNRIAFRTSATNWWEVRNGIRVPILKVIVGSLGDYPPMTNVVDTGPNLSLATNTFPGVDDEDEGVFRVDLTNIYYQLAIPLIQITPRKAVAAVATDERTRFTATGSNIPHGVTWEINPAGVVNGAVLQVVTNWHYADLTPGNVPTNYRIRATSVDNTNFYGEANYKVIKIDVVESGVYTGCNNTLNLHLSSDSSADAKWEIIPRLKDGAYIDGGNSGTNVVINAGIIPTNYLVKASATELTNCFDTCTVTVLKVDLIPDWNHDRTIDNSDKTQAAASNPLRFWINDDADDGDISHGDSDLPGHSSGRFGRANHADNHINGRSDLLDFFPVWLDMKQTLELLPPNKTFRYKLRQDDSALKAVYTDLTKEQAGSYLTTEGNIYGPAFNQNACQASVFEVTTSSVALSETFLNKIKTDATKGVLMMEGTKATTKPLVLEIWRDKQKIYEKEMPLSIDALEKMYRWINLRGAAGGGSSRATDINEPQNYPDSLCNGKQFVFVHGYSVSENGARAWNAEMFKRLYQSGARAMFTALTWFGNEGQWREWIPFAGGVTPNYYLNVVNALDTSASLAAAVNGLPGQKYIAGHSLGNMVVSSAIKDHGLKVSAYFMLNAAVAMETYKETEIHLDQMRHPAWLNFHQRLWASEWHQLFDKNDGRHALTWRGLFSGISNLVFNYYSSSEDVLDNGDGMLPWPLATHWAWYNQEIRKGTIPMWIASGKREGGWEFNSLSYIPSPQTANQLTDDQIRTNSFFLPFADKKLYGVKGSAIAKKPAVRRRLLAAAIPALSNPTGRNALGSFENRNWNLAAFCRGKYQDGNWPDPDDRWRHSHIREIAYPFNYAVFDRMVIDGGLK